MRWCFCFIVFCVVANALAFKTPLLPREDNPPTSGTCGSELQWSLDNSGTLTITGSGQMTNFTEYGPWISLVNSITTVVINSGVTSVGDNAFIYCSKLTTVTMADSVTLVGNYSFGLCSILSSVTLSRNIKTLGDGAFNSCSNLKSITLYDSLETIGCAAFAWCSLSTVSIPSSVTTIGEHCFKGCTSSSSFVVDGNNPAFKSTNGVLYSKTGDTIVCFPAFYSGSSSFVVGVDVVSVSSKAFFQSSDLLSISVRNNNKNFSSENGALYTKDKTILIKYPSKNEANTFTVSNKTKTIVGGAFFKPLYLTSLIFQEGLERIEIEALYKCSGLTELTIPASVTFFDTGSIIRCTGLASINVNENNQVYKSIDGVVFSKDGKTLVMYPQGKNDAHYDIPYGVTRIGEYAFRSNNLTSVSIPPTVRELAKSCFCECEYLKSVVIPASVQSIGDRSFENCQSLESVTFLGFVESVHSFAFSKCSSLKSISYLGSSAMVTELLGIPTPESICVSPEYEGDVFGGYSGLVKSRGCGIEVTKNFPIKSKSDFYDLIEIVQNDLLVFDFNISLTFNIDFKNDGHFNHSLGTNGNNCNKFKGFFEGNNHFIKNLKMNNSDNSTSSLFCGLGDGAVIQNLRIDKTCQFTGIQAGGLSSSSEGEVTIINVFNEATILGTVRTGAGLVSYVDDETTTKLTMINCRNSGAVTSSAGNACGLLCTSSGRRRGTINIANCINSGAISAGASSFGISIYVTNANNIVSMGSQRTHSFFQSSVSVKNLFVLSSSCTNCGIATVFYKDEILWDFKTTDEGTRIDELLNEESYNQNYGLFWLQDLTFDTVLGVNIPKVGIYHVPYGTAFGEVQYIKKYFAQNNGKAFIVDKYGRNIIDPNATVKRDIEVELKNDQFDFVIEYGATNNISKYNESEIRSFISISADIEPQSFLLTIEMDENGTVFRITCKTYDKKIATKIEESVINCIDNDSSTMPSEGINSTCVLYRDVKDPRLKPNVIFVSSARTHENFIVASMLYLMFLVFKCTLV